LSHSASRFKRRQDEYPAALLYFAGMRLLPLPLFSMLLLLGCRYEEGPRVSFRSPSARITANWVMNKCLQNTVDRTSDFNVLFPNYTLSIGDDKNYSITTSNLLAPGEKGTWVFNDAQTEINLQKNGTGTSIWKIKRLTAKEFHASQVDRNGDLIEYQLRLRD
jgi:hypothetical protein